MEVSSSQPMSRLRHVVKRSYTKPSTKLPGPRQQERHTGTSIITRKKVGEIIISKAL